MLEGIAMLTVLAGMGIYFVKSTDIPKDLKDRSAQSKASSGNFEISPMTKKYAFGKNVASTQSAAVTAATQVRTEDVAAAKLAEVERQIKKRTLLALQNQKINELTVLITSLEQEMKFNNDRNVELQAEIDMHLEALRELKSNQIA